VKLLSVVQVKVNMDLYSTSCSDQLPLERKGHIQFISLADERGCAGVEIPRERVPYLSALRDVFTTRHYTNPRVPLPLLLFNEV